jgi:hypothetical protein
MSKYAAFDAQLNVGTAQIETATVVVTTVTAGDANFVLTAAGMTGSPITTVVALENGDAATTVATKAVTAMNLDANITALFDVRAHGPDIVITRKIAAANDATLNLAYADDSSGGLTDDASSTDTTAGVAPVETAAVTNIGGPGLALDTEDVTSHDSTGAWEEVVATILRSGEVTLDIVYDPAGGTHDDTTGLVYRLDNRIRSHFDLIFRSTNNWTFFGFVTGFEPSAPVDGALTASVTIKIDGPPVLE